MFLFCFLAPAVWHRRPGEPWPHTELWGRLACCLQTAEENNWWHFAHSSQRYLTVTEHCSRSRHWWFHPEGFWEGSWQGGVARLGQWHSKAHHLSFKGHHWCIVDDKHPAHWTREVIRATCSSYCVGLGLQTILSWRCEHRYWVDILLCSCLVHRNNSCVLIINSFVSCCSVLRHPYLSREGSLSTCCVRGNALPHSHTITIASGNCQATPQPQPYRFAPGQLWFWCHTKGTKLLFYALY